MAAKKELWASGDEASVIADSSGDFVYDCLRDDDFDRSESFTSLVDPFSEELRFPFLFFFFFFFFWANSGLLEAHTSSAGSSSTG
jgi:hypothetical protein